MVKESLLDKDKAYKIAFRNNYERDIAIHKLKEYGFKINENYTKDVCCLFISTFDGIRIAGWDTRIIYQEKDNLFKQVTFKKLLEL